MKKRWTNKLVMCGIKRVFDLVAVVPALIIASPVFVLVGILVRLKSGSPILFVQKRPGPHGRPFKIYKFRTMTDKRDERGNLLPYEQRLTRGAFPEQHHL